MRGALMRGFFGRPRRPGHPLAVGIGAHSSRAKPTVMGSEQVCNQTFRPDEEGLCGGAIHRGIFSREISFWRKVHAGVNTGRGLRSAGLVCARSRHLVQLRRCGGFEGMRE